MAQKDFTQAFVQLAQKYNSFQKGAITLISVMAERFYRDTFRAGGFTDTTLQRWQPVKRPRAKSTPLVRTGALRGSVRARIIDGNRVIVSSDRNYAAFHNEGIGHNPKRQFIGSSFRLNKNIRQQLIVLARKYFN